MVHSELQPETRLNQQIIFMAASDFSREVHRIVYLCSESMRTTNSTTESPGRQVDATPTPQCFFTAGHMLRLHHSLTCC